jgi:radical SAM protein with 4Fe4S-binding SPASM domain
MKLKLPHIAFEITDACNLNCIYCYNIWKMKEAEHQSFNSYKKAIQTLQQLFSQADIKSVAFTGGEPFLAERFIEVVLFCRMEGKQVTIISNGSRIKESDYKQLLKMGVGLFEFPVHSEQAEIHDRMTNVKRSWEKSIASLKTVQRLGGYVVPVVVITQYNVKELGETLEFINSLGCSRIMLNRYNIGGKGCENPLEISASAEELRQAFTTANTKAEELGLTISSNVCTPVCLLNPEDYPSIGFGYCSFNVLQRPITLDINGNIRLCNHSPVVAGNIWEQSIEEILFSDYTTSWEKSIPTLCVSCREWEKCKGGCRAASEQCLQTLWEEDPIIKSLQL